jgi:hypothetical protein
MDANWQYGEDGRCWQTVRSSCCRVGDAPSTDFPWPFLSPFIRFFYHPHLLTLAAIVPAWKWWNTFRPHPTSTPLHDTFYVMISVTFECEGQADCPFLLQVDVAGMGLQQPISKWIPNGYVTHLVLTQPLHRCMTSFTCLSFRMFTLLGIGMGLQQQI